MSLVDESFEFNSFLGGELVTVESESTTEIKHKNRLGARLAAVLNIVRGSTGKFLLH